MSLVSLLKRSLILLSYVVLYCRIVAIWLVITRKTSLIELSFSVIHAYHLFLRSKSSRSKVSLSQVFSFWDSEGGGEDFREPKRKTHSAAEISPMTHLGCRTNSLVWHVLDDDRSLLAALQEMFRSAHSSIKPAGKGEDSGGSRTKEVLGFVLPVSDIPLDPNFPFGGNEDGTLPV